jgi:hypothetical protein
MRHHLPRVAETVSRAARHPGELVAMGWAGIVVAGLLAETALIVVLARHSTTQWEKASRAEVARRRREAAAAAAARARERFRSPLHHAAATATTTAVRPPRTRRRRSRPEVAPEAPARARRLRVPSWPRRERPPTQQVAEVGAQPRGGVLSRVRRRRGAGRRAPR